jgi:hypothetical protein
VVAVAADGVAVELFVLVMGGVARLAAGVEGHIGIGAQHRRTLSRDQCLDHVVTQAPAAVTHQIVHVEEDASLEHACDPGAVGLPVITWQPSRCLAPRRRSGRFSDQSFSNLSAAELMQ